MMKINNEETKEQLQEELIKVREELELQKWGAEKTVGSLEFLLKENIQNKINEIEKIIDQQLQAIDIDYKDLDKMLGLNPIKVTLLSPGTFNRYYEEKQREGADLAHLKPPHMNASNSIIQRLIKLSQNDGEQ